MTRRYLVHGRVQGVGFRYFAARHANRLGLTGWVRNLPDGRVELLAVGEPELLGELESSLRVGPPHAWVEGVEISEISEEHAQYKGFDIN